MCVEIGIAFLDKKHFIDEAIKFTSTLSENVKLAFLEEACVPMGFQEMFLSSCVRQYAGGGVGLCSRHNLHHTDHSEKEYTTHC